MQDLGRHALSFFPAIFYNCINEKRYQMKTIKTVNIIGLGALGMMYGSCMAAGIGFENVNFIMDRARYEKYKDQEYRCNGQTTKFHMVPVDEAPIADLAIMAVKYPAMDSALETIRSGIGPDTIIMSVMNGISSEGILADLFGDEKMIYTVAQGMDAMKFGNDLSFSKSGELHIGIIPSGSRENLAAVSSLLEKSGLAHVEEEDILYRIWSKFMLNVGINQTCMVYGTTYSGALANEEYNRTFIAAMREVIAIANAEGVALSEKDLNQYVHIIEGLAPENMPSMAQDRKNKRPSEVELFAGTVIKIAEKHGLYVPTNRFLYRRVKEIEAEY